MTDGSREPPTVEVSRMTAAAAADFLREYEREVSRASSTGAYEAEIGAVAADLEAALRENAPSR